MFGLSNDSGLEFTAQDEALLQQTVITEDSPGTILRDFQTMLDYIQEKKPAATKNHQLSLKDLEPLNKRMTRPIQHGLKRPQQKSMPNINGLYLLLRATGFANFKPADKKPKFQLDELVLASWQSLNPTERYFTLLESWLLRGSGELIGERHGYSIFRNALSEWVHLHMRLTTTDMQNLKEPLMETVRYFPGFHHLALMELFGLMVVVPGKVVAGEGWQLTAVEPTRFGEALMKCLQVNFYDNTDLLFKLDNPAQITPGHLQPILQPYFPEWKENLRWPQPDFRDGTHTFLVSIAKDVWRRIAISADAYLEDLAHTILRAFKFDSDHLYRFIYTNHLGTSDDINHPYMDEGPFTSEVRVGDVPLPIGGTMDFNFDFGDDWYFEVKLESVDEEDKVLKRPKILESHGKAPEQYPRYGDEW